MDMKHLKSAAAKGDPLAQCNLGIMYNRRLDDNGHPASSDRVEAVKWLSEAARQGLPRAQQHLAELLSESVTPTEWIESCAWFIRAQANSVGAYHEQAKGRLAKISALLTSDQVDEAERMAASFKLREHYAPVTLPRRRRL